MDGTHCDGEGCPLATECVRYIEGQRVKRMKHPPMVSWFHETPWQEENSDCMYFGAITESRSWRYE